MDPYIQIKDLLQYNSIEFDEVEHAPVFTSTEAQEVTGISLHQGVKSLLIKSKNGYGLFVLPGDTRLDAKKVKKILGVSNLRFATPQEVEEVMRCAVGACYPFGTICKTPMFVDRSILKNTQISFNPGRHDRTITLAVDDYQQIAESICDDLIQSG